MKNLSSSTTENHSRSVVGVVKLWPGDQIQPSAFFVNKILLEQSHTPSCTHCPWMLLYKTAALKCVIRLTYHIVYTSGARGDDLIHLDVAG